MILTSFRHILLTVLCNCGRLTHISNDALARIARYVPVSAQDFGNFRSISQRCNQLLNNTHIHPFDCLMEELEALLPVVAREAGWHKDEGLRRTISAESLDAIRSMHRALSLNPMYAFRWPLLRFAALHVELQDRDQRCFGEDESDLGHQQRSNPPHAHKLKSECKDYF